MPKGNEMNKRVFVGSISLNVILAIWLIVLLIPDEPELVDLSIHTQNDLSKAFEVKQGVNSTELFTLMGKPAVREFDKVKEEWHYCKTGHLIDEYVVIELKDDKVVSSKTYTVSWLDVVYYYTQTPTEALIEAGGMGDCKLTVKWGTYAQSVPNKSINFTPSVPDAQKARTGY